MLELSEQALLDALAERAGVASEYHDIAGRRHVTSAETKRAILKAMGVPTESQETLADALRRWDDGPWIRGTEPVLVLRHHQKAARWSVRLPLDEGCETGLRVTWRVKDEQGTVRCQGTIGPGLLFVDVRVIDGRRFVQLDLPAPEGLPIGYYELAAEAEGIGTEQPPATLMIVAPPHCFVPDVLTEGGRLWGLAFQLYAVRSGSNWGAGDFRDLSRILEWAGKNLGAGIIGLNPLHSLKNTRPYHISPYSPNSRLYVNELYVDVERLPEFQTSEEARLMFNRQDVQAKLDVLRKSDHVDYDGVAQLKRRLLDQSYQQFLKAHYSTTDPHPTPRTARARDFERFIRDEGEALEWFAVFQVLEEEQSGHAGSKVWQQWPPEYRAPRSPAVQAFANEHRTRVRFFQYVQWIAAEQVADLNVQAQRLHMPVGLYQDLALGADPCGADSWMFQDVLSLGADSGAPPDALGPEGQNWGLPPINPVRLRETRYGLFIRLLRNNFRYGGAIRLDHVMALFRLFWIPKGMPASSGTYVRYPYDDLLAIVALESERSRTLVIGEDLGTVPDWVRDQLAKENILSYRVFYFERNENGSWKAPGAYPVRSMAVAGTHDLPTLRGFWSGEDIRVREGLGLFSDENTRWEAWRDRETQKAHILIALQKEGLLPDGITADPATAPAMSAELCRAIHVYLGRTPAWIVLANIEDALGELPQINMPGTVDSHPNWSRKLSVGLDDLLRDEGTWRLAKVLSDLRPSPSVGAA